MKHSKTLIVVLLLMCMLFSFASCGNSETKIIENYEKIGAYIKANGEDDSDFCKDTDVLHDEDGNYESNIYSCFVESDGDPAYAVCYNLLLTVDSVEYKTTAALYVDPEAKEAELRCDVLGKSGRAYIDMENFCVNSETDADGLSIVEEETDCTTDFIIVYANKLIKSLKEYAGNSVGSCSYADLGFAKYSE